MKERSIVQSYRARATTDGAGVHMHRLFWRKETFDMDPFLMLDVFDTTNPDDYRKGFPLHPHRGIETLTYLIHGEIDHKDTLGNVGTIHAGDCQWMSAGSGIMHEEMPQTADRMFGFQLWINLSQKNKMSSPAYVPLLAKDIPVYNDEFCTIKVIAGEYKKTKQNRMPSNHEIQVYDVMINKDAEITVSVKEADSCFVVAMAGKTAVANDIIEDKLAVRLEHGDTVTLRAIDGSSHICFFAGIPFHEPIAWGGPIVMNTQEELIMAQKELQNGTFIKETFIKVP